VESTGDHLGEYRISFFLTDRSFLRGFPEDPDRAGEFDAQNAGFSSCRSIVTGEQKPPCFGEGDARCLLGEWAAWAFTGIDVDRRFVIE